MNGLICIGYQGIGKSTLGGAHDCVDLESSCFWVNGHRNEDWFIPYCKMALNIANQGYTVFTSSHRCVYEYFASTQTPENVAKIFIFCPRSTMKDEWIKRLADRFDQTGLHKDYKALMNAKACFCDDIRALCSCGLPVIQPNAMDYSLLDYIFIARNKWCK